MINKWIVIMLKESISKMLKKFFARGNIDRVSGIIFADFRCQTERY